MKKCVFLTNSAFILIETILVILINIFLLICLYIHGGTEGTFREWFQYRANIVILLPCAIAIYSILMCIATKKNKISGITFTINAIINAIIFIPVLSFTIPGFFRPEIYFPFNESTLLYIFRKIVCVVSYLILLLFNIISTVHILRSRHHNQVSNTDVND